MMFRILGGFLFLLLASCATLGPSDAEKAQLHLKIGTAHLTKGNFPAALGELMLAEKLDPDDAVIQNNLGLAYYVRGKLQLAEKHIRRALDLNTAYTEARNNLGRVLIDQGLYDEAIRELKIAVEDLTYPAPDKSHANLGLAYFKKRHYPKALEELKQALTLNKNSCLTSNYYARSLFELNQLEPASRAFDQAVKTCESQKFDEPLYFSALSYYRLGQREQAVARFKEMLTTFPEGGYSDKARELLKLME